MDISVEILWILPPSGRFNGRLSWQRSQAVRSEVSGANRGAGHGQKKGPDVCLACVKSGKTDGEIEPHQCAATPADYPLDSGIKSATAPSANTVQSGK